MKENKQFKKTIVSLILFVVLGVWFLYFRAPNYIERKIDEASTPRSKLFEAPGKDWGSQGKVEEYFIERLNMTRKEAMEARTFSKDGTVMLRLGEESNLDSLAGNLYYYGFIKDKEAFIYALEQSEDTVDGMQNSIEVGDNTIDRWASYRISEEMTAWEIADILLNKPSHFAHDEYNKVFMP